MGEVEQVGFIGLGLMGTAMSSALLGAGFKVKGYDPLPGTGDGVKANGGETVETPAVMSEPRLPPGSFRRYIASSWCSTDRV